MPSEFFLLPAFHSQPVEQRFRDLETNLHSSVPLEEAKLRLMAPFDQ
jgi:hypothetical protein